MGNGEVCAWGESAEYAFVRLGDPDKEVVLATGACQDSPPVIMPVDEQTAAAEKADEPCDKQSWDGRGVLQGGSARAHGRVRGAHHIHTWTMSHSAGSVAYSSAESS